MSISTFTSKPKSGWILFAILVAIPFGLGFIISVGAAFGFGIAVAILLLFSAAMVRFALKITDSENTKFATALAMVSLHMIVGAISVALGVILFGVFTSIFLPLAVLFLIGGIAMAFCGWFCLFKRIYGGGWKKGFVVLASASLAAGIIIYILYFLVFFVLSFTAVGRLAVSGGFNPTGFVQYPNFEMGELEGLEGFDQEYIDGLEEAFGDLDLEASLELAQ